MLDAELLADATLDVGGTPKLDGIRCLRIDGRALARSFNPGTCRTSRLTLRVRD
jgi:hypothetical protein